MTKTITHAALGLFALSLAATASAQMKVEDAIRFRQSGYTFMAWNMGKIKAQVVDGAVPYNREQVAAAANAVAAVAHSGVGALFTAGSDKGKGRKDTRVRAEFFTDQEEVGKLAKDLIEQANKLQQVAGAGARVRADVLDRRSERAALLAASPSSTMAGMIEATGPASVMPAA